MFKNSKQLQLDDEDLTIYASSKDLISIKKKERKEAKRPNTRIKKKE